MGSRRDDIPVVDRMQMGITVLSSQRDWGAISQFAQKYALSRQAVYAIGAQVKRVLLNHLQPGPHGPHPAAPVIRVDRNRLLRSALVLTDVGEPTRYRMRIERTVGHGGLLQLGQSPVSGIGKASRAGECRLAS